MNLSEIKIGDSLYTAYACLVNDRDLLLCHTCNQESWIVNGKKKLEVYFDDFEVCGLGTSTFFYKRIVREDEDSYCREIYETNPEEQYFATKEEAEAAAIAKFENEVQ